MKSNWQPVGIVDGDGGVPLVLEYNAELEEYRQRYVDAPVENPEDQPFVKIHRSGGNE